MQSTSASIRLEKKRNKVDEEMDKSKDGVIQDGLPVSHAPVPPKMLEAEVAQKIKSVSIYEIICSHYTMQFLAGRADRHAGEHDAWVALKRWIHAAPHQTRLQV